VNWTGLSVHLAGSGIYIAEPVGSVEEQEEIASLFSASPSMIDALMQWRNAEAMGDERELECARRSRDKAIAEAMDEK